MITAMYFSFLHLLISLGANTSSGALYPRKCHIDKLSWISSLLYPLRLHTSITRFKNDGLSISKFKYNTFPLSHFLFNQCPPLAIAQAN